RRPPAIPARLCTVAYDKPHRRRARAASVPPSIAPAARVFRDPTGRADGGARPRAREYPAIPDRAGPVLGSRLVLRVRIHRGPICLFVEAELDRRVLDPGLSGDCRGAAPAVARNGEGEVQ